MIDRVLLVLVIVFIVTMMAYALIIPPWETPDAPSHYLYIRHIVTEGRLPVAGDIDQGLEYPATLYEWHHPPLYYLFHSSWISMFAQEVIAEIPPCFEQGQSMRFSFTAPSARYSPPQWPWWREHPSYLVVLALRLVGGVSFGLPILLLTRATSKHFLKDSEMALLSGAFISLQPQFVFVSISIQNDILAILIGSAIWTLVFVTFFKGFRVSYRQMLMMGVLLGLGTFSKLSIFPVFIMVFLWFVVLYSHQRFRFWKAFLLLVFPGLVMISAYSFYGGEHFRALLDYLMNVRNGAGTHIAWSQLLYLLMSSFWARMGWMNFHLDSWFYYFLTLFALVGVSRTVYRALNGVWPFDCVEMRALVPWIAMGIVIQFAIVLPMFFSIGQPQGRFLFPVLLPLTYVISWGWMPDNDKFKVYFSVTIISSLIFLNGFVLMNLWRIYW